METFLALEELVISLRALAPRSRASGSKPVDEVLGLSLRTLGGGTTLPADCEELEGTGWEEEEEAEADWGAFEGGEEKGEKLKGPSAWAYLVCDKEAEAAMAVISPTAYILVIPLKKFSLWYSDQTLKLKNPRENERFGGQCEGLGFKRGLMGKKLVA